MEYLAIDYNKTKMSHFPSTREGAAKDVTGYLNQMVAGGWKLVTVYPYQVGVEKSNMFVFSRSVQTPAANVSAKPTKAV